MSRQNRLAFLLGLLSAFGPLSIDMYLSSLPDVGRDMGVGIDGAQLTLAAYFLGLGTGQLVHGPLADRLGRRPPLFVGLVVYTIASALCAMATSIEALILLRLCQALAGCAGMVIARAVVRDVSHEIDPIKLMSRLMLIMGVAPILAPLMGGYLAAALGWRAIFWFLAGVGAVALVLCTFFLPETLVPEKRQRASVFTVLRSYLSLLADRRFLSTAMVSGLTMGGMFAYIAGSPFVFISIYGVSPEHYGLFFGAGAAGFILMSQFGGRFAARYGRDRVFTIGVAGVACGGVACHRQMGARRRGMSICVTPWGASASTTAFITDRQRAGAAGFAAALGAERVGRLRRHAPMADRTRRSGTSRARGIA
jgi:DHA1 family bicyclomycin/chloramphenicol resistance-like MFS transporter